MPSNMGFSGPGQREQIVRGERTSPLMVVWQALWALIVFAVAFLIFRGYIAVWEWLTDNHLHSWFAAPAIISILVCLIAGAILVIEVVDPNWPNPRKATGSTRPLTPLSREREQPRKTVKMGLGDLMVSLEEDEDEQ